MWRVPWVSLMPTPCISLLHHLMLGSIPRSWKFLPCPVIVQLNGLCLVTFGVDRMPYTHPCSVSSTLSTIATVCEYHVWKTLVSPACGITKPAQTEVVTHKLRNPRFCCLTAQKLARWKKSGDYPWERLFGCKRWPRIGDLLCVYAPSWTTASSLGWARISSLYEVSSCVHRTICYPAQAILRGVASFFLPAVVSTQSSRCRWHKLPSGEKKILSWSWVEMAFVSDPKWKSKTSISSASRWWLKWRKIRGEGSIKDVRNRKMWQVVKNRTPWMKGRGALVGDQQWGGGRKATSYEYYRKRIVLLNARSPRIDDASKEGTCMFCLGGTWSAMELQIGYKHIE